MTPDLAPLNNLLLKVVLPTFGAMGFVLFAAIGFAVQWSKRKGTCR